MSGKGRSLYSIFFSLLVTNQVAAADHRDKTASPDTVSVGGGDPRAYRDKITAE